jgi:hypothetical protein
VTTVRQRIFRDVYLTPDDSYASLEAYIDATHTVLAADLSIYLAEVAAEEAEGRKRRRAELKAESAAAAAAEPTPARAYAPRACKRARAN